MPTPIGPEARHMLPGGAPADAWKARGICRKVGNPDDWFPEPNEARSETARAAAKACGWCPVRLLCLGYALETRQAHGIWGGLGPGQRTRIARRQGLEAA